MGPCLLSPPPSGHQEGRWGECGWGLTQQVLSGLKEAPVAAEGLWGGHKRGAWLRVSQEEAGPGMEFYSFFSLFKVFKIGNS